MKHIQVSKMDSHILYSLINMRLRNEYSDLNALCASLDIDKQVLIKKLASSGYHYHLENNQFSSI